SELQPSSTTQEAVYRRHSIPVGDVIEINSRRPKETNAARKLLTGPATEVRTSSTPGFLKLRGFTGVGFAQPNTGMCANKAIAGSKIVPIGSMCLMGLRVMRPSMLAVGSPRRFAI